MQQRTGLPRPVPDRATICAPAVCESSVQIPADGSNDHQAVMRERCQLRQPFAFRLFDRARCPSTYLGIVTAQPGDDAIPNPCPNSQLRNPRRSAKYFGASVLLARRLECAIIFHPGHDRAHDRTNTVELEFVRRRVVGRVEDVPQRWIAADNLTERRKKRWPVLLCDTDAMAQDCRNADPRRVGRPERLAG